MTAAAFVNEAEEAPKPAVTIWMERVDVDAKGKETISEPIRTTDKQWFAQYAERQIVSPNSYFRLTSRRPEGASTPKPQPVIPVEFQD